MFRKAYIVVAALLLSQGVHAQSNDFATGNMHFDAHDMDTNGDHMISRDELMAYAQKMWEMMAQGKDRIPVKVAAKDFATGGVNWKAREIDTDHDGTISREEYLAYVGRQFDSMKKTQGLVSMEDMTQAFARGNKTASAPTAKPPN